MSSMYDNYLREQDILARVMQRAMPIVGHMLPAGIGNQARKKTHGGVKAQPRKEAFSKTMNHNVRHRPDTEIAPLKYI